MLCFIDDSLNMSSDIFFLSVRWFFKLYFVLVYKWVIQPFRQTVNLPKASTVSYKGCCGFFSFTFFLVYQTNTEMGNKKVKVTWSFLPVHDSENTLLFPLKPMRTYSWNYESLNLSNTCWLNLGLCLYM